MKKLLLLSALLTCSQQHINASHKKAKSRAKKASFVTNVGYKQALKNQANKEGKGLVGYAIVGIFGTVLCAFYLKHISVYSYQQIKDKTKAKTTRERFNKWFNSLTKEGMTWAALFGHIVGFFLSAVIAFLTIVGFVKLGVEIRQKANQTYTVDVSPSNASSNEETA